MQAYLCGCASAVRAVHMRLGSAFARRTEMVVMVLTGSTARAAAFSVPRSASGESVAVLLAGTTAGYAGQTSSA